MNLNQIRQFLLDQSKSLIQFGNSESTNIDANVVAFLLDNAVAEIKAKVKKRAIFETWYVDRFRI